MFAPAPDWDAAIRWWDGVELWLAQLWLPLQLALLVAVLLPACWWAARVIDWAADVVFGPVTGRGRGVADEVADPDGPP